MKKINQFIKNYLDWSNDSKKFIKLFQIIFYSIPAVLMPIGVLATCFGSGALEYTGGIVKVFAIIWALVFGYISFKILWSRAKDLLTEVDTNKYFVIPALAHYLRTYGEVFGAVCFTIPIFLIGVQIAAIGDGFDSYMFYDVPLMNSLGSFPIIGIFIFPLYGYFILLFTKLISESLTALVDIANNTSK
jgi:hypothetical protein